MTANGQPFGAKTDTDVIYRYYAGYSGTDYHRGWPGLLTIPSRLGPATDVSDFGEYAANGTAVVRMTPAGLTAGLHTYRSPNPDVIWSKIFRGTLTNYFPAADEADFGAISDGGDLLLHNRKTIHTGGPA